MTRARVGARLLPAIAALAIAACATERKPLVGFDKPPPGSIVLDMRPVGAADKGSLLLWPMFDLPLGANQIFRPRLDGQDAVVVTSDEGFYDYARLYLQGWTAGWNNWLTGVPPGSHVVEIVDGSGQVWGRSAPLAISPGVNLYTPGVQVPAVIFANYDGKVASWNVDPAVQDADAATDEITVTNMVDEDVVVERCLVASGSPTSCTPVGTVAPGADLRTVETVAASSKDDHQSLLVRLASDPSQVYRRDLAEASGDPGTYASACQIERIIVHGARPNAESITPGPIAIAMSSCYGYRSGPP